MAYISRVKSNDKYYIYLTIYEKQKYSSKNEKHIYSFGKSNIALYNMKKWLRNFDMFPQELRQQGFSKKDLETWIKSIREKEQKKRNLSPF